MSLDRAVTTGMLGADYARGRWPVDLALTQSDGGGEYRSELGTDADATEAGSADGTVESSLTTAIPDAALRASERPKLWGAAGYGSGEVALKPDNGETMKADTSWTMAAAGMRSALIVPPAEGGGIARVDPKLGLSLDIEGRTLIALEADGLKDRGYAASLSFDSAPATQRGPSFSLRQEFGGQANGGPYALFQTNPLEDRAGSEAASRCTMEAA